MAKGNATADSKGSAKVLGRSAATGRFVLKPASKPGKVTLQAAKAAVTSVRNETKK